MNDLSKHLQESKRFFKKGDYIKSLIHLEKILDNRSYVNKKKIVKLRILLRELAGDYLGALEDIENFDILDRPIESLLLSWIGKQKRAKKLIFSVMDDPNCDHSDLRNMMGIGGRRLDLKINNIYLDSTSRYDPNDELFSSECVVEHLLCLNKCSFLRDIKRYIQVSWPRDDYINELEKANFLQSLPKKYNSLFEDLDEIDGWLSVDEAWILYTLSKRVPKPQQIVEIGSFKGKSTIPIARGTLLGSKTKIHSIDIHEGLEGISDSTLDDFKKNLEENNVLSQVDIYKNYSTVVGESWDRGKIGLLFIDASHEYEDVSDDYFTWKKHLGSGSFVIFHDANMHGPNKLIREIISNDSDLGALGYMDSLFVFKKGNKSNYDCSDDFWNNFLLDRRNAYENWIKSQDDSIKENIMQIYGSLERDL